MTDNHNLDQSLHPNETSSSQQKRTLDLENIKNTRDDNLASSAEVVPAGKAVDLNEFPRPLAIHIFNASAETIKQNMLTDPNSGLDRPIEFITEIDGSKFTINEAKFPLLAQIRQAIKAAPAIYSAHKALEPLHEEAKEYKQTHRTNKLSPDLRQAMQKTKLKLLDTEADIKQILARSHRFVKTDAMAVLLGIAASQNSKPEERDDIFKNFDEIMQGMRGETAIINLLAELDPAKISYRAGLPEEDLKQADILIEAKYANTVVPLSFDVKCKRYENGERFKPDRMDTEDVGQEKFNDIVYHQLRVFISDDAIDAYCRIKPEYKEALLGRIDEIVGLRDFHTSRWRPRS